MSVFSFFFLVPGINEVDYSHYPDRSFQLQWLRSYLEAYKEHKGQNSDVTDREVEVLYVQVNRFALVSFSKHAMENTQYVMLHNMPPFCI